MPDCLKCITSTANPLVKRLHLLNQPAARKKEQLFLAEGDSLVRECIDESITIRYLLIEIEKSDLFKEMIDQLGFSDTEIILVSKSVMEHISKLDTPPPIIAVAQIPQRSDEIKANGQYIVLDNLQDPGNMGAVIRSAAAFGMDGIIFCGGCDVYSPKVIRGSMGAIFKIPGFVFENTDDAVRSLKDRGLKIYAATIDSRAISIADADLSNGTAVIIGNEGNGISSDIVRICDFTLYIPIRKNIESLNAAVAASVIMWEMNLRR